MPKRFNVNTELDKFSQLMKQDTAASKVLTLFAFIIFLYSIQFL